MKRNTITIIKLIMVICVIVVVIRVWGLNYANDHYICPKCWSSDIYESGISNNGFGEAEHTCRTCKWHGIINPLTKKEREYIQKVDGLY